ncbi:MAG: NAD(P)-binding domain-containing protein, partial [Clostridia bacterium]|nr:NAD(P)-binding domain-containing protein [Clostridia bacterium]
MQNFAFIGMGNMARAIASGLIESGAVQASAMCAYAPHQDKLRAFCEPLGIRPCQTAREAISAADTVIMAVKPYIVEGVLHEQRSALADKALLSVVAGYTLERYSSLL